MPTTFLLHILINTHSAHTYPYVAINPVTSRIINICEEHISLLDPIDSNFLESDYLLTSRSIIFDLELLDKLVANYIGPHEYNIITRFTPEKHITLRYHSPTNEGAKDYDIYLGYPDIRAEKLVETVYAMMKALQQVALEV